jgi:hypothetical protein
MASNSFEQVVIKFWHAKELNSHFLVGRDNRLPSIFLGHSFVRSGNPNSAPAHSTIL